jgi:hypothetical protein
MFRPLLKFIGDSLCEDNGRPSSIRLMTFIVCVLFTFALTFALAWEVVTNDTDVTVLAALYMGTILGCLGIKVVQKNSEEKVTTSPTTDPTK